MALSKEGLVRGVLKRFAVAERGTGGLKRFSRNEFTRILTAEQGRALLTEPIVLTCDGVDNVVMMTVEQYFSISPPTQNPRRNPEMLRHEGKLYREVV